MARGYGDDMNRDRWRDDDRERSSYGRDRNEDRGFFERAGDQLRSWFSEDDDRGPGRDYQRDTSWNRDQQMNRGGTRSSSSWDQNPSSSSWDNDLNRGSRGQVGWSGGSSWDQNRGSGFDRDRERSSGGSDRSGYDRSGSNWEHGQGRSGYGQSGGAWTSSADRDPSRTGFGGFRDESDFRNQRHRSHQRSWSEANRGENESLGFGEFPRTLGGFGNQTFGSSEHDHYRNWRDREMSKLDRDYDDYCREREQQFNQDFDSWRRSRQSQGPAASSTSPDLGTSSNAGVGTTTASMTGSAGSGSAIGSATGTGGSIQSDTTGSTETAGAGGGRSGSRSRG